MPVEASEGAPPQEVQMDWFDDDERDSLNTAVIDAAIALRVACWFARPRGPGSRLASRATREFDELVDEILDDIALAETAQEAAKRLDRLCEILAETANASEKLASMPGAQLGWNELLHGRAELARAYQEAAALRWRAWRASKGPVAPVPCGPRLVATETEEPRWGTVGPTL